MKQPPDPDSGRRPAFTGCTNRICRKRRLSSAEDYRNRTDPKRNQSAGKCQFTIHFGPADDRSRFEKGLRLTLTGEIISRPYIDLTLQLMNRNGADAGWTGPNILEVKPQPYQPTPYYIESDWSAASYWYAFAALTPRATLRLPDLYQDSLQGDARVAELFPDWE